MKNHLERIAVSDLRAKSALFSLCLISLIGGDCSSPIVHVYGSLGALPYAAAEPLDVSFGSEAVIHQKQWQGIKTYTEEDHDTHNLAVIHALFRNAFRLVFLGMSYHTRNMDLLFKAGDLRPDCEVWGTADGLSQEKRTQTLAYFDHPTRKGPQLQAAKCGEFFEHFGTTILAGV